MSQTEQQIYVVDDDEAVRDAISMLLETVGIAHRVYDSATAFLEDYTPDLPGCLVLDIRMPGISGLELQEELGRRQSTLPIIFITGHGDIPMAVDAMRKGAVDFIKKPFRDQDLLDRIHEALEHDARGQQRRAANSELHSQYESLSPRERQVFERVAKGQANKVIAIELSISERTVEIHRAQVMKKMHARTLAQLVRSKIELERDSQASAQSG